MTSGPSLPLYLGGTGTGGLLFGTSSSTAWGGGGGGSGVEEVEAWVVLAGGGGGGGGDGAVDCVDGPGSFGCGDIDIDPDAPGEVGGSLIEGPVT